VDEPVPFRVEFSDDAVADLRDRLRATRWPERETVDDWSQGVPRATLRELCRYWAGGYDFAAAQDRLNRFPQFHLDVDGLPIHFLHVRSPHADALPLLLTHGWPGSIVEFLDVVDPLSRPDDPADAFHIVVPSLPGYGFSGKPTAPGWNIDRTARAWNELMGRLGYDRYGAQGGDWGAFVTTTLARTYADHVVGIHTNLPLVDVTQLDLSDATSEEQAALDRMAQHDRQGRGYGAIQGTRPQTLGYGLTDSPAGQCAWIFEKFHGWTDHDGDPEQAVPRDTILDNVSVYWFTATATSSARMYWESRRTQVLGGTEDPQPGRREKQDWQGGFNIWTRK
jgi:pimeloyl-ACP methyl ester carboxylesterase